MSSVSLQGVTKIFDDGTKAVDSVNLSVADGEFVVLVGPSGCGKSTALRMIAGLEEITEGDVYIGDLRVSDLSPKKRDIAMVFQSYALYPHMTVAENMGFALKIKKVSKSEIETRVREAAEILAISDYLHRKPKALSGGQRQRVAMGRAIVRSPQAFLMDEPLSNLDAKLRVTMRSEITALQKRLGTTTIYVTHDQVEAMTMGDRVAVLKVGVLQQVAAPEVLYETPLNLFVASFVGSPAMNIGLARLIRHDEGIFIEMGMDGDTHLLRLADAALDRYPAVAGRVGSEVAFGIRPEHLNRARGSDRDQVWSNQLVSNVERLGAEALIHFETTVRPVVTEDIRAAVDDDDAFKELQRLAAYGGGQEFIARVKPSDVPRIGDRLDIFVDTETMHFFDVESGEALR